MKKRRIGISIFVGVLATSIIALSGCSSSQSSSDSSKTVGTTENETIQSEAITEVTTEAPTEATASSPLAGTYELVSVRHGEAEVGVSGVELIIDNQNNGTEKTSYATNRNMVFDLEAGNVTIDNAKETCPFSFDGSTITITSDGADWIYKKN